MEAFRADGKHAGRLYQNENKNEAYRVGMRALFVDKRDGRLKI